MALAGGEPDLERDERSQSQTWKRRVRATRESLNMQGAQSQSLGLPKQCLCLAFLLLHLLGQVSGALARCLWSLSEQNPCSIPGSLSFPASLMRSFSFWSCPPPGRCG